MNDPKIVLLAGKGISTNIIYHALKNEFPITAIILEEPVSKNEFLKKRIKKLGILKVTGQVFFQLIIVKFLDLIAAKRKKEILQGYAMDNAGLPPAIITPVNSVNDNNCLQALQKIAPDLVIVNGTRVIAKEILNNVGAKFINMHAGITPMYRGVHGAYWALVNNDAAHCGVTVHLVDPGIDTGAVIARQVIPVTKKDNFVTYPLIQLAEGIPLVKKAIEDILHNRLSLISNPGESRLWSHPGFFQYLYYRILKGKK